MNKLLDEFLKNVKKPQVLETNVLARRRDVIQVVVPPGIKVSMNGPVLIDGKGFGIELGKMVCFVDSKAAKPPHIMPYQPPLDDSKQEIFEVPFFELACHASLSVRVFQDRMRAAKISNRQWDGHRYGKVYPQLDKRAKGFLARKLSKLEEVMRAAGVKTIVEVFRVREVTLMADNPLYDHQRGQFGVVVYHELAMFGIGEERKRNQRRVQL